LSVFVQDRRIQSRYWPGTVVTHQRASGQPPDAVTLLHCILAKIHYTSFPVTSL